MSKSDNKDLDLSKYQILSHSGIIASIIINLTLIAAFLFVGYKIFINDLSIAYKIIGGIVAGVAMWQIILVWQNIRATISVVRGKYKIVTSRVHGFKFRHPYMVQSGSDRVLELDKIRITVDSYTARKFDVGDTAVIVFVDKIKYPIIIAKLQDFKKINDVK